MSKLSNMSMDYLKGSMSTTGFKVLESYLNENKDLKNLKLLHTWNVKKAEADVLFGNDIERVENAMLVEGYTMNKSVIDYQIVCDTFKVVSEREKEWYLVNGVLKMNGFIDVYATSSGVASVHSKHPNVDYLKLEKDLKEFNYTIKPHERGFDVIVRI
jgi:hypothetical protein